MADVETVIARLAAEIDVVLARTGDQWRAPLLALLDGIARRRMPGPDDPGLPAPIDHYRDAVRLLWTELSARARAAGLAGELISRANLPWAWVDAAVRTRADSPSRLVDALFTGSATAEQARRLGFDPDATFQVICCRPAGDTEETLGVRLRAAPGTAVVSVRPGLVVVVFQRVPASDVLTALGDAYGQLVGLGLARQGLTGAAESLTDAEAALRLSLARGRPASFEDEWMPIILMLDADRLRPLVAGSAGAPAHLEEAVVLWAYSDFSIPAAARKLHIHPNTLKYRLDRWREVTGWDPRSRPDLELTLLHHNLNTVLG